MSAASLHVVSAGALVTVQDAGRFGRLRFGIAASGPMDRFAHAAANQAVGNDRGATAIEVSRGGVEFDCGPLAVTVGVSGGSASVELAGERVDSWSVVTMQPGQRLSIRSGDWGSWAYLAVAGNLRTDRWLGSTATHSIAGLGGGALVAGQILPVDDPRNEVDRDGSFVEFRTPRSSGPIRVVLGPQRHHFVDDAEERFRSSTFTLTDAYDRMGVRLSGALLPMRDALSIPSEPIVRGSIQVAGDGVPTILLADHQTTGGYPKIATVISSDLDRVVQHRPGDAISFEVVTPVEAVEFAREHARAVGAALDRIARPGRNLSARLMREDLIGVDAAAIPEPDID